jgi:hypothetical protein
VRLFDADCRPQIFFSGMPGSLRGKQLKKLPVLNDYWFDWKIAQVNSSLQRQGLCGDSSEVNGVI